MGAEERHNRRYDVYRMLSKDRISGQMAGVNEGKMEIEYLNRERKENHVRVKPRLKVSATGGFDLSARNKKKRTK
jgi:hypothetical protein